MRARFVDCEANRCILTDVAGSGDTTTREFWAAIGGGYVREVTASRPGALGYQVCTHLRLRGDTLRWNGKGRLIDIRREHRKGKAAEKRADARYR